MKKPKWPTTQPTTEHVGRMLTSLRKSARTNQTKIARHLGVEQSVVSRMEDGNLPIPVDRLIRWSAFLGVSASAVLLAAEGMAVLEESTK